MTPDRTTVVRCLGCAMPEVGDRHRCAGDKPLQPYGGWCQCPRAGCGPTTQPTPQRCEE